MQLATYNSPRSLADFDEPALAELLAGMGQRTAHAGKILREFYASGGEPDFSKLFLNKPLRRWLAEQQEMPGSRLLERHAAADGTVKLLLGFRAGGAVETVFMPAPLAGRAMGCVSSQIGCAMGCDFCASTRGGLERNLSAGEIVQQFLHLRREAAAGGRRLTTLVFMGMGEPMHNFDQVVAAIGRIAGQRLGNLGWRQVTISTVGIVPGIDRLAEADLNVHLAVSLHAPDDATRNLIVPVNRRYPLAEVVAATRRFYDRTGRIPTIEYCLLSGVNDSDGQARALAGLLSGLRVHVNLIAYNPTGPGLSGIHYHRPDDERVARFLSLVRDGGLNAHVRVTRGDDVNAACGQLRETHAAAPR